MRIRASVGLAPLVALALTACGLDEIQAKRDNAERIADAYEQAVGAGMATGTLGLSVTIEKTRRAIAGIEPGFTTPEVSAPITVDVANERSESRIPGSEGDDRPFQVYDGAVLYQHLPNSTRARTWLAYDVGAVYDEREELTGEAFGSNLVNPAVMLQLLDGPLTGSVTVVGTDVVNGVSTTHYKANFDVTKALADAPRERREAILAALALMSVKPEVIKGEVWLDDAGVPRRTLMRFRERFTRRDIILVNVSLTLDELGVAARIAPPAPDEFSRTDNLGAIARGLQALAQELGTEAGFGGGGPPAAPGEGSTTTAPAGGPGSDAEPATTAPEGGG